MDCEYTNQLLKERLSMNQVNTRGKHRIKANTGLSMIARQTQVLYQQKQQANPRTTIIT
jgi:transposase, IS5 family